VQTPWHLVAEWSASGRTPAGSDLLKLAAAELALGRVTQARRLLAMPSAAAGDSAILLALRAMVAAATDDPSLAATYFGRASELARANDPRLAGVLAARSAAAAERAGDSSQAAPAWARARELLPAIVPWLGLREAAVVADPVVAQGLLARAPESARPLALAVLARLRLAAGDTVEAERLLAEAGHADRAATLALARGDTLATRDHVLAALAVGDTAQLRAALVVVDGPVGDRFDEADHWWTAMRAAARMGQAGAAAQFAARAVAAGDSGPAALVRWGERLEAAGRRGDARSAYQRAGRAGDFPLARASLRAGDRANAIPALRAFADAVPDDAQAPIALYLAADAANSDSLFAAVASHWPRNEYAARARQRLVLAHLARADTSAALGVLDGGTEAAAADGAFSRFHAGRLRLALGDTSANTALRTLARLDSLGYYGFQARALLALPGPTFARVPARRPAPGARALLDRLALLDAAGLDDEAALLVSDAVERRWEDADEMLDVAEGLAAEGRPAAGIRLAWRASTRLTLNHPRVLRAVFPWPDRESIETEAAKHGVDPFLLAGLIRQESGFAAAARSRAGAEGMMQLMPATAREVARRQRLPWHDGMRTVADANLHVGTTHLAGLLRRYGGDPVPAIAAYNAGGTPVGRWLRQPGVQERVLFVERITYAETQGYVRTVLRNRDLYLALYGPGATVAEP
jgi:soluble lytic murein transglycosylase